MLLGAAIAQRCMIVWVALWGTYARSVVCCVSICRRFLVMTARADEYASKEAPF